MCIATTCRRCKKPSWSGCGQHIEVALKGVPHSERCVCDKSSKSLGAGFFAKLFGKAR